MIVLTEEQVLIQKMAREFAMTTGIKKTQEAMMEYAQKGQAPFGFNQWNDVAELGFAGITVPKEYGGMGLGMIEKCLILEELSKSGSSIATNLDAHGMCINTILFAGSEEQKQKYLVPGASGKLICAVGATDPAGSSNFPEWSITVEEKDDHYVLNGTKYFVTNSINAGLYAIFTKSENAPGPMDCYLVERGYEGVEDGQLEFFGRAGSNTGTVNLKNVKVPKENKIPNSDLFNSKWLALGFLDFSSIMNGISQSTLDRTIAYTTQRSRGGKPLNSLQAVAHRLANMATDIELSRAITLIAAQRFDAGDMDRKLHSMAKIKSSETLASVGLQCTALHGSAGSDPATGVLAAHIGAPQAFCGEFPNDLHRDMIAKELGIKLHSLIESAEM